MEAVLLVVVSGLAWLLSRALLGIGLIWPLGSSLLL